MKDLIDASVFKNLFSICAIQLPESKEEFESNLKSVSELVNFIDEYLSSFEIKEDIKEVIESTNLRSNHIESIPEIRNLSPKMISGLFCVPGLKHIEE